MELNVLPARTSLCSMPSRQHHCQCILLWEQHEACISMLLTQNMGAKRWIKQKYGRVQLGRRAVTITLVRKFHARPFSEIITCIAIHVSRSHPHPHVRLFLSLVQCFYPDSRCLLLTMSCCFPVLSRISQTLGSWKCKNELLSSSDHPLTFYLTVYLAFYLTFYQTYILTNLWHSDIWWDIWQCVKTLYPWWTSK